MTWSETTTTTHPVKLCSQNQLISTVDQTHCDYIDMFYMLVHYFFDSIFTVSLFSIWQRNLALTLCGLAIYKPPWASFSFLEVLCLEGKTTQTDVIQIVPCAFHCPALFLLSSTSNLFWSDLLAGLQISSGHGWPCLWPVLQLLSSSCCWP